MHVVLTRGARVQGRSAQGEGVGVSSDAELVGGARIRHVFQAIFASALDNLDPCNGLTDEQARPCAAHVSALAGRALPGTCSRRLRL